MLRRELQDVRKRVTGQAASGSVVTSLEDLAREEARVDPIPRASTDAVRHAEHAPLVVIEEGVLAALGRLLRMRDGCRSEDDVQAVGRDQRLRAREEREHSGLELLVPKIRAPRGQPRARFQRLRFAKIIIIIIIKLNLINFKFKFFSFIQI